MITAMGGMIACMVTGKAEPDYVLAEEYSGGDEPVSHGVETKMDLPQYPIAKPDPQHIAVLGYLVTEEDNLREGISYSVRKKDLTEFGEQEELPVTAHYDGNSYNGQHRWLENLLEQD